MRTHHIAYGYAALALVLGLASIPLSGGHGLVVVTLPMLGIAGLTFLCALVSDMSPRVGTALTTALFLATAGFFSVVELSYAPYGSRRESLLRDIGSAMERHVFPHAPVALAGLHVVLALAVVLLIGRSSHTGSTTSD